MESECCALVGTDCRPTSLRRRARRPQLKRDPLGSTHGALTPTKDDWRRRLNAASLAQTKYLWLLLVLGVFYWVVHSDVTAPSRVAVAPVSIPGLTVPLPLLTVWASGASVLFYVLLVILGTLRAYLTAETNLKPESGDETVDDHLNAIDWAAYTTHSSAALVKWLLGFSYPLYMTIFTVEATILLVTVARSPFPVPGRSFFTSIAVLEGILTYGFLVRFWWGRARRWPRKSAA